MTFHTHVYAMLPSAGVSALYSSSSQTKFVLEGQHNHQYPNFSSMIATLALVEYKNILKFSNFGFSV